MLNDDDDDDVAQTQSSRSAPLFVRGVARARENRIKNAVNEIASETTQIQLINYFFVSFGLSTLLCSRAGLHLICFIAKTPLDHNF
jgi:hypothetical protein